MEVLIKDSLFAVDGSKTIQMYLQLYLQIYSKTTFEVEIL